MTRLEPRSWRERYALPRETAAPAIAPSSPVPDRRTVIDLPDEMTVHAAATLAAAGHLKLVIDHNDGGKAKLTPFVFPGMQVIHAEAA